MYPDHGMCLAATNKVRMLEDGVTERIKSLLRSDMPPVQFKLLGTLRMMVDGQGVQVLVCVSLKTNSFHSFVLIQFPYLYLCVC